MEFDLNEIQKLFQRSARELFSQECPSVLVRETTEKDVPHAENIWKHLVDQGWTGLIFPEEIGGLGLGMVEMAVAFEEMGRALVPGPYLSTVPLAGTALLAAGSSAASKYLRAIADGTARATVALLEEGAAWDLSSVALPAAEAENGLTLNGKKLFVTDAGEVDLIITAAKSRAGLVLAAVNPKSPGVTINPMPSIDSLRPLYEVVFDGVVVPGADVLAEGRTAVSALENCIDVGTLALAAEMLGGMQWILDATVEYAKTRKQFGKPIGQFQAVQHHCANMLLMTESTRSAVYYAAWVVGNDPALAPLAISMAKAYASDCYREVGNLGIQVHGGIGFTWDHEIHFYYKRAKASELMFGDAIYHRERIARIVMDGAGQSSRASARAGD
jgi:alkylation response protein AidB-like acyl-CoA dehydrogenase